MCSILLMLHAKSKFIDCSLDIRTVHINIAKNALTPFKKGDLSAFDFLTYVRGDPGWDETTNLRLPSWAPNLQRFDRFDLHKSLYFRPLTISFPSSAGLSLFGMFTVAFGSDESLQVKAIFLDKVATVVDAHIYFTSSDFSMDPEVHQEYIHGLQIWEAKAHSLAMSLKQYSTNEDISVVYSKILSFDYLARSNPMSDIGQRAACYAADHTTFQETLETLCEPQNNQEIRQKKHHPDALVVPFLGFLDTFDSYSVGHSFPTTKNGYMGWFPEGAQAGDDICVFPWSLMPFVVRQSDMGYRLFGGFFYRGYDENRKFSYST